MANYYRKPKYKKSPKYAKMRYVGQNKFYRFYDVKFGKAKGMRVKVKKF